MLPEPLLIIIIDLIEASVDSTVSMRGCGLERCRVAHHNNYFTPIQIPTFLSPTGLGQQGVTCYHTTNTRGLGQQGVTSHQTTYTRVGATGCDLLPYN